MKMSKEMLHALKDTITTRWFVFAFVPNFNLNEVPDCQLCDLHECSENENCGNCIVKEYTEAPNCYNTPYYAWTRAFILKTNHAIIAKDMLKLLMKMLPYNESVTINGKDYFTYREINKDYEKV